ncbi:MAG: alpha/beta fold hydrolase [Dehalococcoidia bacterium]
MAAGVSRIVRSRAFAAAGGLLALALLVYLAAGWYVAGRIEAGTLRVDHAPGELRLTIEAVEGNVVTLRARGDCEDKVCRDGVWGLEWAGGHATIGPIAAPSDATDGERLRLTAGELSLIVGTFTIGEAARLESLVYFEPPRRSLGISFEDVKYGSRLGDFAAWFVDGTSDGELDQPDGTWVIYVHGKGSRREEALRILPVVNALGFPSLMITYRNDDGAYAGPSGRYEYGATEWRDLEAAVRYALSAGAQDVVLYGYSMGGAIVLSFLYESSFAGEVRGVILDAPMLDFRATVRMGVERGAPGVLVAFSQWLFARRYDVDWEALDYVSRVDRLTTPVLLFHGSADDVVPFETSARLAEARPDLVQFEPVAGAGHVAAWNTDPRFYEAVVREFLERVAR